MSNLIAVSTNTYHKFSLEEALSGIAQAGFRSVELSTVKGWTEHFPLDDYSPQELHNLQVKFNQYNLQLVNLSAHSDLGTAEGVEHLKKAVDFAEQVGAKVINTGTIEKEEHLPALLDNLSVLGDYAQKKGKKIGLEIHGDFLKNGLKAKELMEQVRHPAIGINYDTGNAIFYGNSKPEEDIKYCLSWLVHIHLKDKRGGYKVWDFPALGEGEVNFRDFFSVLDQNKIQVPLSVEIEFDGKFDHDREFVDQAVRQSFQYLSQLGLTKK
ncbi:MAG: hypothetical protein PWP04_634 [Candidatus Atribacteria bacterium]|nr:hypothetical protein [Candidatus Atribacteria bacterium]